MHLSLILWNVHLSLRVQRYKGKKLKHPTMYKHCGVKFLHRIGLCKWCNAEWTSSCGYYCLYTNVLIVRGGSPHDVVANTLDIVVSLIFSQIVAFTFRLIPLGKVWTPLSLPGMGYLVPILSFYEDSFGIRWTMKVDIPFKKETKPMWRYSCKH